MIAARGGRWGWMAAGVAGQDAAALAAQPLPVEQVAAGQFGAGAGAAEAVDGLTVAPLGGLALAEQGGQAGLDPQADRIGTDKGSGLGLSIVAAIAEAHGGALDLRARPGGGLRVCVHLPAAAATTSAAGGLGLGVLEALLAASPAFLRAEDLLEQAWDEQADPFTNTVTVTIGRLRRKLGDPLVIATRPGVGYRICDRPA